MECLKAFGSSPHTWGIPAGSWLASRMQTVHPHIRGAYEEAEVETKIITGSSPHTWGILANPIAKRAYTRFIPTYVGHTF